MCSPVASPRIYMDIGIPFFFSSVSKDGYARAPATRGWPQRAAAPDRQECNHNGNNRGNRLSRKEGSTRSPDDRRAGITLPPWCTSRLSETTNVGIAPIFRKRRLKNKISHENFHFAPIPCVYLTLYFYIVFILSCDVIKFSLISRKQLRAKQEETEKNIVSSLSCTREKNRDNNTQAA